MAGWVMTTPAVVELLVLLLGGSTARPMVSHSMMKVLLVLVAGHTREVEPVRVRRGSGPPE